MNKSSMLYKICLNINNFSLNINKQFIVSWIITISVAACLFSRIDKQFFFIFYKACLNANNILVAFNKSLISSRILFFFNCYLFIL